MLGRLEMDVDECISAYSDLMKTVFDKKSSWLQIGSTGSVKVQFDLKKLKNAIEGTLACHLAFKNDLFNDGNRWGCRV